MGTPRSTLSFLKIMFWGCFFIMNTENVVAPDNTTFFRPRALAKKEYFDLTGDYISAVLLNQIEYRTTHAEGFNAGLHLKEEMDNFSNHSPQYKYGWILKSANKWNEECILGKSANTIRYYLLLLEQRGWITSRPHSAHSTDRTKEYRFNAYRVACDLKAIGWDIEGWRVNLPKLEVKESQNKASKYRHKKVTVKAANPTELPCSNTEFASSEIVNKDLIAKDLSIKIVIKDHKPDEKVVAINHIQDGIKEVHEQAVQLGFGNVTNKFLKTYLKHAGNVDIAKSGLVYAEHYLATSGTPIRKSLEGLLMHQVTALKPALIYCSSPRKLSSTYEKPIEIWEKLEKLLGLHPPENADTPNSAFQPSSSDIIPRFALA